MATHVEPATSAFVHRTTMQVLRPGAAVLGAPGTGLLLCVLLCFVLQFEVLRFCLLWTNRHLAGDVALADIAWSFLLGLRFDLATAAFATIPLHLAATCLRLTRGWPGERGTYLYGALLLAFVFWFLGVAETEFYADFFSRYNSLALHYWSQPLTVVRIIWHGYPVVWYLLLVVVLWLAHLGGLLLLSRPFRRLGNAGADEQPPMVLLRCAVWLLLLVVAARGGLRSTPLKWGDASHSESTFINQLTLNGFWTLGHAVLSLPRQGDAARLWQEKLPISEAHQRARELLVVPGDENMDDGQGRPLLRRHSPWQRTAWLDGVQAAPPNVVVIIMESFTARFCGACGAGVSGDDYTPEFNRLAQEGILFDRCFSAGTHTHQANVAISANFPNLPGHETLMEDFTLGTQPFDALPRAFQRLGYETWFFYNGALEWENLRGFYTAQGTRHFVSRDDFPATTRLDSTWGVSDYDLFTRANREFARAKRPFYATILTLSNHAPFDLPRPLPFPEIKDQGAMNDRLNGIRYADWALGQFFAQARREKYFANTLFVLVGDHGYSVAPVLTDIRLLRFHVPLLFYSPLLQGALGQPRHCVASQLDIAPTVLGLVGDDSPHQHWGRDLFALSEGDPGMAVFKPSERSSELGYAVGDLLLVKSNTGGTRLYRYDLGFPPKVECLEAPATAARLDRDLQAFVTTAEQVLLTRHAAP